MQSPISPSCKKEEQSQSQVEKVAQISQKTEGADMLTPPNSSSSTETESTLLTKPLSPTASAPNHHDYYYQAHLSKAQFNSILVNSATNLLKILYSKQKQHTCDTVKTKQFIIEILKRSKTSIQSLQLACFYIYKLIITTKNSQLPIKCQHLFLGLVIIASKFNQDYNYSFKSWCKIIGLDEDAKHIQHLRSVEIQILGLLNYELGLMGDKYENWCNILFIFGYDFIKYQIIKQSSTMRDDILSNDLIWDLDMVSYTDKLSKWWQFFNDLNIDNLKFVKIRFETYFSQQLNQKVFIVQQEAGRKRCRDDVTVTLFDHIKKIKV
ncbi:PCL5 [Candida theae]|uniref:PCL5 n=1 Tax=Candida theae TaxID=1198502 RepID=A0AAD5FWG1_9ASCO|nr:PCL5 [Candida theae]KAI5949075.1 PCL5 [Candida theae]